MNYVNVILILVNVGTLLSTDMSFLGGGTNYWCEWPSVFGAGKFFPSHQVIQKWPNLLYAFLESKLTFEGSTMPFIKDNGRPVEGAVYGQRMMTRSRLASIKNNGFPEAPVIKIMQRPEYDRILLAQPSVGVTRRRTLMPNVNSRRVNDRRVTLQNPVVSTTPAGPSQPPDPVQPIQQNPVQQAPGKYFNLFFNLNEMICYIFPLFVFLSSGDRIFPPM